MIVALALLTLQLQCGAAEPFDFAYCRQDGDLFQFRSHTPYRALEIRPLARFLHRRMEADRRFAIARARAARARARREDYPYNRFSLAYDWTVEGRTYALISLSAEIVRYEGGGHAEEESDTVLWDIGARRPVTIDSLFDVRGLRVRFCAAWREQRQSDCPSLIPAMIAPADRDGNGRFDTLSITRTSSDYSESRTVVDVALEPEDLAGLPEGYRRSFEAPGERREPLSDD